MREYYPRICIDFYDPIQSTDQLFVVPDRRGLDIAQFTSEAVLHQHEGFLQHPHAASKLVNELSALRPNHAFRADATRHLVGSIVDQWHPRRVDHTPKRNPH